jgi:CBS domain-containing protein
MRISEVMTRGVESTTPEATLQHAAIKMRDLDVGSLPVTDESGRVIGVVTDRDIVIRAVASGVDPTAATVDEAMTAEVVFCREDQDVNDAAELMSNRQIRRLIILDRSDRLAGIIALGDIAVECDETMVGATLEAVSEPAAPRR